MGIKVEFNPDLALRDFSEFENGRRKEEECIPKDLKKEQTYKFLKRRSKELLAFWRNPFTQNKWQ